MSRVLYLAEPIDQARTGTWKKDVAEAATWAASRGWLIFRPAGSWVVGSGAPVGPEIEAVNRYVLASAGAVLAFLPAGVPTVGVPREVEWATANGTPTMVMTDRVGWSLHDVTSADLDDLRRLDWWLGVVEGQSAGRPLPFALEGGELPTRANLGDAGYDLYVSEDVEIPPGQFVDVPCGVRVALPPGFWGRITGRSSTLRKRQLLVAEGVIDTGYRGPLFAGVWNLGEEPHKVLRGERIAQFVLHENVAAKFRAVPVADRDFAQIPGDGRGTQGFGSTGS